MSKQTVRTLKLSREQEQKLLDTWREYEAKAPAYARFCLRPENCVITCYESGKTVFQGSDADVYASPFMNEEPLQSEEPAVKTDTVLPQAGSDEVGTGDYFGPVCVCAAIVTAKDMSVGGTSMSSKVPLIESLPPIDPMPSPICASNAPSKAAKGSPHLSGSFLGEGKYSWNERYTSLMSAPVAISLDMDSITARYDP